MNTELQLAEERLAQAQAAEHALLTGNAVQVVSGPDGSTTYMMTTANALRRYITDLRSQIARLGGAGSRPRSPIYPVFPNE